MASPLWLLLGLVFGVVLWQWRERESQRLLRQREQELAFSRQELAAAQQRIAEWQARAQTAERLADERWQYAQAAEARLSVTFKSLAADALQASTKSLMTAAENTLVERQRAIEKLVRPLQDALQTIEVRRAETNASLQEQLRQLADTHARLHRETTVLGQALRAPQVRGRWGEMQLRRVIELAGMVEHCDFTEQCSVTSEEGMLRPDLVVQLPGGRTIIVDAKAPLLAYLDSFEQPGAEERTQRLRDHARHVRGHVQRLASKRYQSQFQQTPDFVVAFLPGEPFFSAAVEHDPTLLEYGSEQHVLLTTPMTLIALLKTVAMGWRQERLTASAEEMSRVAAELYERLGNMTGHWDEMRRCLERSVQAYNKATGSLEGRVLVSARKLRDLGVPASEELPLLEPVEVLPREHIRSANA